MRSLSSVALIVVALVSAAAFAAASHPHRVDSEGRHTHGLDYSGFPVRAKAIDQAIRRTRLRGEPDTVKSLNVSQYLGRWFEVYQDWMTAHTFQQDSFCATADYGPSAIPGVVTVSNREHYGNVTGPQKNVSGFAYRPDADKYPGRLVVYLHGQNASPFPAPYWVLQLGPVISGMYDYAIVSDSMRLTLFVLARNPQRFHETYQANVMAWLASNGFAEWYNAPEYLEQKNCTYFPPLI